MSRLSTRILVALGLTLAFAIGVAWVLSTVLLEGGLTRVVPGLVRELMQRGEQARCEADPSSWTVSAGEVRLFAYDEARASSLNVAAEPFATSLLRELNRSASHAAAALPGGRRGGVMLVRVADAGPCALVQVHWRSFWSRGSFAAFLLGVAGLLMLVGVGVVSFVSLRPLARRIESVRVAALQVGVQGPAPAFDQTGDELGQISRALGEAHARILADTAALAARHRDLERHLSDVSHDLRTPLASLQLALEAAHAAAGPELRPLVSAALQDAVYLGSLTTNLALASRLREGWRPVAPLAFALGPLVERVAERCRFFARHRGLELGVAVPDAEVWVQADAVAVEQALRNVVDNAITHVQVGGHIAVVLEAGPGTFRVVITDDGPGVAPAELPRLGERTFRSDAARQRDPRGSGLGLAITAEVCAGCGWTLRFANAQPSGLEVTISGTSISSPHLADTVPT